MKGQIEIEELYPSSVIQEQEHQASLDVMDIGRYLITFQYRLPDLPSTSITARCINRWYCRERYQVRLSDRNTQASK